jgi:diguanylate cyclase (GGDEF)-like protein/PAS domain S-box-containing protein
VSINDEIDFQFLAENSVDIICCAGIDRVFTYVSPSSFSILGWNPEEMVGRTVFDFILSEDIPVLTTAITNRSGVATIRMKTKNGLSVWMENRAREILDPDTRAISGHLVTMRDISVRKRLEEELSRLALTDGLTGLANRRAFDEDLEREWKRTLREDSQISLLLLDVDHFKEFNDRYGHQLGDDCLRAVADAVRGSVRVTDIVARYGGEEIAIILPTAFAFGADEVAEKIRLAIESLHISHEGGPEGCCWLTASIGVATAFAEDGESLKMPDGLLFAADAALYKAKHMGRNCVAAAPLGVPQIAQPIGFK